MAETLTKWPVAPLALLKLLKSCRTVVPSSWVVSTDLIAVKVQWALQVPMDVLMLPMRQWGNNIVSIITKDRSIRLMNNLATKRRCLKGSFLTMVHRALQIWSRNESLCRAPGFSTLATRMLILSSTWWQIAK